MHKEFKYRDRTFRLGINNYYNDIFYFDVEDEGGHVVETTFYQNSIDEFVKWIVETVKKLRNEWKKKYEERLKQYWREGNG